MSVCFSCPPFVSNVPAVSNPLEVFFQVRSRTLVPVSPPVLSSIEPSRPLVIGIVKNGFPAWPSPIGTIMPMILFFQEKVRSLLPVRWMMTPTEL